MAAHIARRRGVSRAAIEKIRIQRRDASDEIAARLLDYPLIDERWNPGANAAERQQLGRGVRDDPGLLATRARMVVGVGCASVAATPPPMPSPASSPASSNNPPRRPMRARMKWPLTTFVLSTLTVAQA